MNELEWFNKVSYIMVNLRAEEKEVSIYRKRVKIIIRDVSNEVLNDDLHFIAHVVSLYRGSKLDVNMSNYGQRNSLKIIFSFRSTVDKLLGRYTSIYE